MDFSKLLILGSKNILEDTEEISLKGKEDKEVRKIILDNFLKLFSHCELFNEGRSFSLPHGFRGIKIPDSLAYCKNEERLWIFEYKSKIDEELIEQVRKYRNVLKNNDNLNYLQDELYKKEKRYLDNKILKKKAKIICISPQFDNYAKGIEEEGEEEIYLIKITKYKDKKGNLFILLQTREENSQILSSYKIIVNKNVRKLSERPWLDKLKEWVSQKVEPMLVNNSIKMWLGKGGGRWDFGKKTAKEVIFSISFRGRFNYLLKPKIFLVSPSELLIKKWQLEPKEFEIYFYSIETEANDGYLNAQYLIIEFMKEKS
ncbi:MAG: hypothetical protein MRERC_11c028 [Mycoplasmataceae bacterium RC_NB112A]|nr:MAG: hypothetical protein MRERC_11c028 [Mycoplasmataceae bacterium RC_NB112A]